MVAAEDIREVWMGGVAGEEGTRAGAGAGATKEGEGDVEAATLAPSRSIKTWAKCPPFFSSYKATMTPSLK